MLASVVFFAFLVFLPRFKLSNSCNKISEPTVGVDIKSNNSGQIQSLPHTRITAFQSGISKPDEIDCSKTVVLPCLKADEVAWIKKEIPNIDITIYAANDSTASLYPPMNKGHEVMVYLTYIIENYSKLPDVVIFMHAHRWTHHNNDILGYDAVEMITRLNNDHVIREGYVNMRCEWDPGCPEWLHPNNVQENLGKQEEAVLSRCWGELFPLDPLPRFLAQACCAQFALSKERILSIPLSQFIFFRNWIMMTPLSDYISGRIWEYSWHYIFTRRHISCPAEHNCCCDTFGICFGGESQYKNFVELRLEKRNLESKLKNLLNQKTDQKKTTCREITKFDEDLGPAEVVLLQRRIQALQNEIDVQKMKALDTKGSAKHFKPNM